VQRLALAAWPPPDPLGQELASERPQLPLLALLALGPGQPPLRRSPEQPLELPPEPATPRGLLLERRPLVPGRKPKCSNREARWSRDHEPEGGLAGARREPLRLPHALVRRLGSLVQPPGPQPEAPLGVGSRREQRFRAETLEQAMPGWRRLLCRRD